MVKEPAEDLIRDGSFDSRWNVNFLMPKTLDILIPKVTRKVTFPGILPGMGVGRTKITWWQSRVEINKGIFQLCTTESSSFNEQFTHR